MDDENKENKFEREELKRILVLSIRDLKKNPEMEEELDDWGDFDEDIEENVDFFFNELDRLNSITDRLESIKNEFMFGILPFIIEDWDKKSEDQKRIFVEEITLDESVEYCKQYEEFLEGKKEETKNTN